MYKIIEIQHVVQIPPNKFGTDLKKAAFEILSKEQNNQYDEIGFVIAVVNILEVMPGKIITGSPSAHHPVRYEVLVFEPQPNEIVEGTVVELVDYGAFIRLGPIDALVHVSQIANDYFKYEGNNSLLTGRETQLKLALQDEVRGRILAVNMAAGGKLGLTLRHHFLGKFDWIKENIQKALKGESLDTAPSEEEEADFDEEEEFD
jgi:DNA-directed RNA polymerase subunit E'